MGVLSRERGKGNTCSDTSTHGYRGWVSGQIQIGERHDGLYFRASGEAAEHVWKEATELGYRASRIDLAATVWYDRARQEVAREAYAASTSVVHRAGRPPSGGLYLNASGGSTCYVGSRSSEKYGRIYDKAAESGSADYRNSWRYELELKGDSAAVTAVQLSKKSDYRRVISEYVAGYFAPRGVRIDWHGVEPNDLPDPTGRLSDDDSRLAWLASAVAPAVRQLSSRIGLSELLGALGLSGLDLHDDRLERPKPSKLKSMCVDIPGTIGQVESSSEKVGD
jgi:DNA relaxase NicK